MVVTPPNSIVWLTPDDLRSMGATMTGKPSQVPTDQSTTSQAPMQIDPSAKAAIPSTSQTKKAPEWKELVNAAFAISARQNGGKPLSGRSCQPELKLCSTAVFFKREDGVEVMLRMSEDTIGSPISRDICTFNEFRDVRTCSDWDTGALIREMKNKQGDWVKVGDQ